MNEPADRPGTVPPIVLAQLLDEQRRSWRQGDGIPVETFLARLPMLRADNAVVLDLIYQEIILREQRGERPRPDDYLRRFPHLSEDLALQFEVDRFLETPGATASPQPAPPSPVAGRAFPALAGYEIHGVLGRGGMGLVYKARQLASDRTVAVKSFVAEVRAGSDAVERFRADAETITRLNHRHIAPILEVGARHGRLYVAAELHDQNLAAHVNGAAPAPQQIAGWLETLARTLHVAHKLGVLHRALKPTNVFIGGNGVLKIGDFGTNHLAGVSWGARLTQWMLGTPHYLAPEQTTDPPAPLSRATDVYSLGAILYELLARQVPFQGICVDDTLEQVRRDEPVPPSVLQRDVPADLESICLKCLRKEPKERYASAEALAQDLVLYLRNMPVGARHLSVGRRIARWTGGWLGAKGRPAPTEAEQQRRLLQRHNERLQVQLEMARRLIRLASIDGLLPRLAESAAWLAGAESATVFVLDPSRRELWSRTANLASKGRDEALSEIRQGYGVGIAGLVAAHGQPIHLADVASDPRFKPAAERNLPSDTRNLVAVPIRSRTGEMVGVLQVVNALDGGFDAEQIEALSAYADSAAVAIEQTLATA